MDEYLSCLICWSNGSVHHFIRCGSFDEKDNKVRAISSLIDDSINGRVGP